MPARTGLSSCSAVRPILPRPSARNVPRCAWVWPIWLRVCVIRTLAIVGCYRRFVGKDLTNCLASHPGDVLGTAETPQAVHRRLRHVDRIRRAEALGQDVPDS